MDQNDRKLILCDGIVPLCFPDEDLCCVLHFWSDKYREKERDTILEGKQCNSVNIFVLINSSC